MLDHVLNNHPMNSSILLACKFVMFDEEILCKERPMVAESMMMFCYLMDRHDVDQNVIWTHDLPWLMRLNCLVSGVVTVVLPEGNVKVSHRMLISSLSLLTTSARCESFLHLMCSQQQLQLIGDWNSDIQWMRMRLCYFPQRKHRPIQRAVLLS